MKLLNFITALTERATRPGLLGVAGRGLERRCTREVGAYFRDLAVDIYKVRLEEVAGPHGSNDEDIVRHAIMMKLSNVLRRHTSVLKLVLQNNLAAAYELALLIEYHQEAKRDIQQKGLDKLGPSGEVAAKWASQSTADLVTGINDTTQKQIADVIMQGIRDRAGVGGTGRLIRDVLENASRYRAEMIASTEMNRAMSTAALQKMGAIGIEYKQIILSDNACPVCEDAADQDPLPVDEDYDTDDGPQAGPPFHPNCRCAVTGARPPEEE
jgi:cytochrome c551/c552